MLIISKEVKCLCIKKDLKLNVWFMK
jgi:hypothetical protein